MVPVAAFRRAHSLVRQRGLWGAARRVFDVVSRRLMPGLLPVHPFDAEHGVETGGLLSARKIRSGHANDAQNTAYFGSQPSVVRAGLQRCITEAQAAGQNSEDFTFVDIGCGKGRVLMLASELPFRRVVGVELSLELVRTAQKNLECWALQPHLCRDISVFQVDVLDFPLPEGPTLLYMYHPFEEKLFQRWLDSLLAALPYRTAPLYLLYVNPYFETRLLCVSQVCQLWTSLVEFSAGEIAAHCFGGTAEWVSLYRLG